MLRALIGAEAFRAGMDLYFSRCDGTAATVEDFLACFAEVSGRDLTNFKLWYAQSGTPVLTVRTHWDQGQGTLRVDVAQSLAPTPGQPDKAPMTMPIALGLVDRDDGDVPLASADANPRELETGVFVLEGERRSIAFTVSSVGRRCRSSGAFPRRCGSRTTSTEADLLTLLARDSDSFNRWQALQTLATRLLLRAVSAIRAGAKPAPEPALHRGLRLGRRRRARRPHRSRLRRTGSDVAERGRPRARDGAQCRSRCNPSRSRKPARRARPRPRGGAGGAAYASGRRVAVLPGRRERRPTRTAQRRAGDDRRRQRGRAAPISRFRQIAEADNMSSRLGAWRRSPVVPGARRERALPGVRPPLRRRTADPRQMVRAAGPNSRGRNARPCPAN